MTRTLVRVADGLACQPRCRRRDQQLLADQVAYYRAVAPEYHEHALADAHGGDELTAALDAFRPAGDVLELACGPGTWTARLLRHATA